MITASIPIEMTHVWVFDDTVQNKWIVSEVEIDPADYPGLTQAWFETVADNNYVDANSDKIIELVDENGNIYAQITAVINERYTRQRVAFSLSPLKKKYYVRFPASDASDELSLNLRQSRIWLDVVNSTRLRVQIPMIEGDNSTGGGLENEDDNNLWAWCHFTDSTTYGYGDNGGTDDCWWTIFYLDKSKWETISHWTLEVMGATWDLSAGQTASFALFNKTTGQQVLGREELLAATACTTGMTLTYQIFPTDMSSPSEGINFILSGTSAGAGDTLDITGTDVNGDPQTESIDVSAGDGTYSGSYEWRTITNINCSGWSDGTLQVKQQEFFGPISFDDTETTPTRKTLDFSNDAINFDDLSEYEVLVKLSSQTYPDQLFIYKANLYVTLEEANKAEVRIKIGSVTGGRQVGVAQGMNESSLFDTYVRYLHEPSKYEGSTTYYFESSGKEVGGDSHLFIYDTGQTDVGAKTIGANPSTATIISGNWQYPTNIFGDAVDHIPSTCTWEILNTPLAQSVLELGGFHFDSLLSSDDIINEVFVGHIMAVIYQDSTFSAWTRIGAADQTIRTKSVAETQVIGDPGEAEIIMGAEITTHTNDRAWVVDDLLDANFKVRIRANQPNNSITTWYIWNYAGVQLNLGVDVLQSQLDFSTVTKERQRTDDLTGYLQENNRYIAHWPGDSSNYCLCHSASWMLAEVIGQPQGGPGDGPPGPGQLCIIEEEPPAIEGEPVPPVICMLVVEEPPIVIFD